MTPIQRSQCSHLHPSGGSRDLHDRHPFLPIYEASPFPCATFCNPCQRGSHETDHQRSHHPQQVAYEHFLPSGSTWQNSPPASLPIAEEKKSKNKKKKNNGSESDPSNSTGSIKWMPSKMRLMRNMMNSGPTANSSPREGALQPQNQQQSITDHASSNNSNQSSTPGGAIRVCSDCNTTKTPLWRSGPRGPKSLCNACGIRQRKARRAMAAAGLIPAVEPAKVRKQNISADSECTVPFKKRCKFTSAQTAKKLHFDDITVSLGKNSAFQSVFPLDEKEAAILLMALSCGLIRG